VNGVLPVAAAAAVLADGVVGEPPPAVHPVAAYGRLMTWVEARTYHDRRSAGIWHVAVGVAVAVVAGIGLRRIGGRAAATVLAAELAVSGRMLTRTAEEVRTRLDRGEVESARSMLPALVGRDATVLDAAEMARAVVESVAENTVDAVVAPALWAATFGAPGVLAHRAVNTLDSMVGHRSPRYERFGWAAARLDDAMAWLPARVTAAAVAVVRPGTAGAVWRAVRDDAPAHPSPNAGVVEAAFAAALGVRLGGVNRYGERVEARPSLGTGRTPTVADIGAAVRLSRDVRGALAAALGTVGAGAMVAGRRSRRK
jgi:adenosylcobinamide-phosphate synthase